VWEYAAQKGTLPPVGDAAAAEEVVRITVAINNAYKLVQATCGDDAAASVDEVDADVVRKYAMYAGVELQVRARAAALPSSRAVPSHVACRVGGGGRRWRRSSAASSLRRSSRCAPSSSR
jgi:hypothetical protein